jgi:hypothetical protein
LSFAAVGLASFASFFIISRFFSLLNSLSKIVYITSFSFKVVSYNGLHNYIMETVPSASPIAAIF